MVNSLVNASISSNSDCVSAHVQALYMSTGITWALYNRKRLAKPILFLRFQMSFSLLNATDASCLRFFISSLSPKRIPNFLVLCQTSLSVLYPRSSMVRLVLSRFTVRYQNSVVNSSFVNPLVIHRW